MDIFWSIVAVLALVLINAFFVAAEFAAIAARTSAMEALMESRSFLGRFAWRVKGQIELYIAACQFGVTLSSLGLGAFAAHAFADVFDGPLLAIGIAEGAAFVGALAIALCVAASLHVILGEQAPRNWALQYADRLLPPLALPLVLFTFIFYPLIILVSRASHGLLRLLGVQVAPAVHTPTPSNDEELRALLTQAVAAGTIAQGEGRLLKNAMEFTERRTRQIMTPRTNVDFLLVGQTVRDILSTVQKTQYTRLPLCQGDLDHVVGLVHMKDLFNHLRLVPGHLRFADARTPDEPAIAILDGKQGSALHLIGSAEIDLKKIRRDVMFVPESLLLPKLLRQFQTQHTHMAIVVDEYGATQGIVTMEDVLEELVGDIGDEFDPISPSDFVAEKDGYRCSGLFPLHELQEKLALEELDLHDVDTVGGYIVQQLSRWPKVGDVVSAGGYDIRVLTIQQKRVGQVLIKAKPVPAHGA